MRVTVHNRDGQDLVHVAPDVRITIEDDFVAIVETFDSPNGESNVRTRYLRESIARIVEHDYMPDVDDDSDKTE
jgi:hypothetical protein